jgi:hypothetical protein
LAFLGVLLWSLAPDTGVSPDPFLGTAGPYTTRYLLPTLVLVTLTLGLAARGRSTAATAATMVFPAALAWSLVEDWRLGSPSRPPGYVLVLGAVLGAGLTAAAMAVSKPNAKDRSQTSNPVPTRAAAHHSVLSPITIVIILSATVFVGGHHLVARHGASPTVRLTPGGVDNSDSGLAAFLSKQPAFNSGDEQIVMNGNLAADLAGDRLRHPLRLLLPNSPCTQVHALAATSWLILGKYEFNATTRHGAPTLVLSKVAGCMTDVTPTWVADGLSIYVPRSS